MQNKHPILHKNVKSGVFYYEAKKEAKLTLKFAPQLDFALTVPPGIDLPAYIYIQPTTGHFRLSTHFLIADSELPLSSLPSFQSMSG